jgi:hypothetical protein
MPLARYFLIVGGVLFALLFIVSALAPKWPVAENNNGKHSTIRIHSEMKLPERVVYDTSLPMIVPVHTATTIPAPAAPVPNAPTQTRGAFAQLQPSDAIHPRPPEGKKREAKHQHKTARRYAAPPEWRMARQPHFGWLGYSVW